MTLRRNDVVLLAQTVGYFVLLAFAGIATIVLSRPV